VAAGVVARASASGRIALVFLILCAIGGGAGAGFLFVYWSDLPEVRSLEEFRPNVVTELYADDGSRSAPLRCSGACC